MNHSCWDSSMVLVAFLWPWQHGRLLIKGEKHRYIYSHEHMWTHYIYMRGFIGYSVSSKPLCVPQTQLCFPRQSVSSVSHKGHWQKRHNTQQQPSHFHLSQANLTDRNESRWASSGGGEETQWSLFLSVGYLSMSMSSCLYYSLCDQSLLLETFLICVCK